MPPSSQPMTGTSMRRAWSAFGRARARLVLALVWASLSAACATVSPPPKPAPTYAQPPRADSPFALAEDGIRASHGPEASGFMLLERNEDALAWRLALVDSARHTLDLQYYVWFGDRVGQLLMARVIAAADRGVRVRILFDDLNTMLHDMTHLELRDAAIGLIDRHPNIEIRLFNAWYARTVAERLAEGATRFTQLNRRMHNKQMIADNRVAIVGGRNIGDEYFGLNPDFNFHDLDVLGIGPVARDASKVFDRYWNSDTAGAPPRFEGTAPEAGLSEASVRAILDLQADPRGAAMLEGRRSWGPELAALSARLHTGRGRVDADPPARDETTRNRMPETIHRLMRGAQREVLITNAYIIPDATFVEDLRALTARGVSVRILTNSLASHDVPAVNSHYEGWRVTLLGLGVTLHELRPDAAFRSTLVDTAPGRGEFVGLHVKAMVVDRERVFVGSMNLDPRSEVFNSEMGVVVDSAPLALALAAGMERDMAPSNSWRVELGKDGAPRWTSDAGTLDRQPARNALQRIQNLFFKLFPPSLY
jgi:putative cardiolipin synthase